MANKKYLIGILVMVLVFGIMAVGCDNGTTSGSANETNSIRQEDLYGTWKLFYSSITAKTNISTNTFSYQILNPDGTLHVGFSMENLTWAALPNSGNPDFPFGYRISGIVNFSTENFSIGGGEEGVPRVGEQFTFADLYVHTTDNNRIAQRNRTGGEFFEFFRHIE